MSILNILLIIAIFVAIIVGIYLILALKKITETLDDVRKDMGLFRNGIEPILENISIITEKAANISSTTEQRVLDISDTIQNVKNTVSRFSFKGSRETGRNPVQELLSNVTAFSKGFSAFWKKLNN